MIKRLLVILLALVFALPGYARDVKDTAGTCQVTVPAGWEVDAPGTRKKPANDDDDKGTLTLISAPGKKLVVSINSEDIKIPMNERKKFMAELYSAKKTLASETDKFTLELEPAFAGLIGPKSHRARADGDAGRGILTQEINIGSPSW